MNILVINCGSSSIKFALLQLDGSTESTALSGLLERIGESASRLKITADANTETTGRTVTAVDHRAAFQHIFEALRTHAVTTSIDAIGHRVVHGGTTYGRATPIDDSVVANIRELNPLAPLHNPVNLMGIEICRAGFPQTPQVAVFDTAFHQTLPAHAYRYAVPETWFADMGMRRYGFHGTAHQYLAEQATEHFGRPVNLITLHLGNGASACAIRQEICIDTSMGFTPLEGLIMGTRSGDLDPAAVLSAARRFGLEPTEAALLHDSGLKGLCGSNDMRDILRRAQQGDAANQLALDAYCYRIRKYVGAYYAALGQVDALVFSGGVGENATEVRQSVCAGLENLGICIDGPLNCSPPPSALKPISTTDSPVAILVIEANEELAIARQTRRALFDSPTAPGP